MFVTSAGTSAGRNRPPSSFSISHGHQQTVPAPLRQTSSAQRLGHVKPSIFGVASGRRHADERVGMGAGRVLPLISLSVSSATSFKSIAKTTCRISWATRAAATSRSVRNTRRSLLSLGHAPNVDGSLATSSRRPVPVCRFVPLNPAASRFASGYRLLPHSHKTLHSPVEFKQRGTAKQTVEAGPGSQRNELVNQLSAAGRIAGEHPRRWRSLGYSFTSSFGAGWGGYFVWSSSTVCCHLAASGSLFIAL